MLSVIIPFYNSSKYLVRLLDSICEQDSDDYEVIMIDDGSTDDSVKIVKQYEKVNKRIKHVSIKNSGPGFARKVGFEKAVGDLLFFIDSDDYLLNNNSFSTIQSLYNKNKYDILFFNVVRNASNKEKITNVMFKHFDNGFIDKNYFYINMVGGALWGKIFVKEKMSVDDFISTSNYEDYYTTYHYLAKCKKIYVTNDVFYYANRDYKNSLSKLTDATKIEDACLVLDKLRKQTEFSKPIRMLASDYYKHILQYYFKNKKCLTSNDKEKILMCLGKLERMFNFSLIRIAAVKCKLHVKKFLCKFCIPLKRSMNE